MVDKQIQTHDPRQDRNFIDLYVKEMKKTETAEEKGYIRKFQGLTDGGHHFIDFLKIFFLDEQLILTCLDFFFPALTAVGTQVTFLLQFCLKYPEVKEKIQREIDDVVGHGRLATLDDRIDMPYTEAAIREVMRFDTLVPSSIPHKAMHASKFLNYEVPKVRTFPEAYLCCFVQ